MLRAAVRPAICEPHSARPAPKAAAPRTATNQRAGAASWATAAADQVHRCTHRDEGSRPAGKGARLAESDAQRHESAHEGDGCESVEHDYRWIHDDVVEAGWSRRGQWRGDEAALAGDGQQRCAQPCAQEAGRGRGRGRAPARVAAGRQRTGSTTITSTWLGAVPDDAATRAAVASHRRSVDALRGRAAAVTRDSPRDYPPAHAAR